MDIYNIFLVATLFGVAESDHLIYNVSMLLTMKAAGKVTDVVKNGNSCKGNSTEVVIQFVLVQDATGTYKGFLAHLKDMMPTFLATLSAKFPETQFALASFIDYQNKYNKPSKAAYCYKLFQPLTYDHEQITKGIGRIQARNGGNDDPESSLTAILYTATDKTIGWSNSKFKKGKRVYKVIAVTTDESWKSKEEPGIEEKLPRPDAKGDGTDTCNNYPPSVTLVKEVLDEKDIFLLGLIGGAKVQVWKNYFSSYGFKSSRSKVVELDPKKAESIAKILIDEFARMITQEQCNTPIIKLLGKSGNNMTNFQGENRLNLFDPE